MPTWSEQSNISLTETSVSRECFIALLIHVSFAIPCVSVCVCILKYIQYVCVCLCVHSLASAADNANPVYFSFPLSSVFQIYLTPFSTSRRIPRRRTRPLPCTHTRQNKGSPPIFDSLSEYVKHSSSSRVNAEKLPELSGPLTGLPCGQMGHGCVWWAPTLLGFLWLSVDNQQGGDALSGRALAYGEYGRKWLWCCSLPLKPLFLMLPLQ